MNRILALSPHPDDVELGAGGFLLNELRNNSYVKIVYFYKEKEECVDINSCNLKYEYEFFDDIHRPTVDGENVSKLDSFVYSDSYDYLLIPHAGDSHQDHQIVNQLALASSRKFHGTILQYEVSAYVNNNKTFNPNVFFEMDSIQNKLDWCSTFTDVSEDLLKQTHALAVLRGASTRKPYAESFELVRWIM